MKKVWGTNASSRLADLAFLARRDAYNRARQELRNSTVALTPLDLKGRGPTDYLTPEAWDSLCDQWNKEEEEKKFAQAKKNHNTEKGSTSKHTCGSIPVGKHRIDMENIQKRKVSNFEVYEKIHLKKGTKTFIDDKSKNVSVDYRERTCYVDPPPGMEPPPFDFEAWKEIIGCPKKGAIMDLEVVKVVDLEDPIVQFPHFLLILIIGLMSI